MRVDKEKLQIALSRACKNLSDLRMKGLSPQTLSRVNRGENVKPATLGKIAKALGIDPLEIIKKEEA